jgi:hypothetical protein
MEFNFYLAEYIEPSTGVVISIRICNLCWVKHLGNKPLSSEIIFECFEKLKERES